MQPRRSCPYGAVAAGLLLAVLPTRAEAFNFSTPVSDGCHEAITTAAQRLTGWPPDVTRPAPGPDHAVLVDQLLFEVPEPADPWLLALLLGARWNDLRGERPTDLPALAEVHLDPDGQQAHCARAPEHDGPEGALEALAECRAFVLEQVEAALGDGKVGLSAVEEVDLALKHQRAEIILSRFAFRMGSALHALQDSYSHTIRVGGTGCITDVLNSIDLAVSPDYDPARDGPPHDDGLDTCAGDAAATARASAAVAASAELLGAVVNPAGGRAGRLTRVEAVLDRYLSIAPACSGGAEETQDWRPFEGALERSFVSGPVVAGCTAASSPGAGSALLLCSVVLLGVAARRRRFAALAALGASVLLATVPGAADAKEPDETGSGMSLRGALGASVYRSAAHAIAGMRFQVSERVLLGVDAEINPWVSVDTFEVDPGTASLYGNVEYQWVRRPALQLASKAHLGVTASLFDLVGVDAWSAGPYVGLDLLSAAFELQDRLWLTVDPATTVVEILRLSGVPVYHFQYRFTVGLRFDLG